MSVDTVRRRIRREELEAYRDNRGRWQVRVNGGQLNDLEREPTPEPVASSSEVEFLRAEVKALRAALTEANRDSALLGLRLAAMVERTASRPPPQVWSSWLRRFFRPGP